MDQKLSEQFLGLGLVTLVTAGVIDFWFATLFFETGRMEIELLVDSLFVTAVGVICWVGGLLAVVVSVVLGMVEEHLPMCRRCKMQVTKGRQCASCHWIDEEISIRGDCVGQFDCGPGSCSRCEKKPEGAVCPNCEEELSTDAFFCGRCGTSTSAPKLLV